MLLFNFETLWHIYTVGKEWLSKSAATSSHLSDVYYSQKKPFSDFSLQVCQTAEIIIIYAMTQESATALAFRESEAVVIDAFETNHRHQEEA